MSLRLFGLLFCLLAQISRPLAAQGPPPVSAPAPRYTVTDLGEAGQNSQAEAVNNRGQVVGWQGTGSFLWDNGMQKIISAQPYQGAHGINEAGQVVGIPGEIHVMRPGAFSILSGASAFVWDRGHLDYLPGFSNAYAINAQGQIAGESGGRAAIWERRHVSGALNDAPGFIWQSLPARKIGPMPGYPYGVAYGLNAGGEAVGVLLRDRNNWPERGRAFRFQDGKPSLLPIPAPGDSAAFSVNETGAVAGAFRTAGGPWRATVWSPDNALQALSPLPGQAAAVAHGLNAAGQTVGWAMPQAGAGGIALGLDAAFVTGTRACLWQGKTVYDLNTLIPPGAGWDLQEARAINDAGWIVGGGRHRGEYHAFLLIPASAPKAAQEKA